MTPIGQHPQRLSTLPSRKTPPYATRLTNHLLLFLLTALSKYPKTGQSTKDGRPMPCKPLVQNLLLATVAALSLIACNLPSNFSTTPTSPEEQAKLNRALSAYQLPAKNIDPTSNPDPDIHHAIAGIYKIALAQKLTFDGTHADQGVIIVGKQGSEAPILMALSVYKSQGRLVTSDTTTCNGMDSDDCLNMRNRLMREIQK
jgi:hypothetical protein